MADVSNGVVRIGRSRIKDAASVLSRAFHNDPVVVHFIPDPSTRAAKSQLIFNMVVQYSVLHGEVYGSANLEAVAVWLPSDKVKINLWNGIINGGLPILFRLGPACIVRQVNATDCMCAIHDGLARYDHRYLYVLGSEPALQGKGHAGDLMRPMLARLDAERLPCYLDNTNEKNMGMYQHYGFKVLKEYSIPKTDVRVWAMVRNAPLG